MRRKRRAISAKEQAEFEQYLADLDKKYPPFSKVARPPVSKLLTNKLKFPIGREGSEQYKSLSENTGSTAPANQHQYTGSKMLGVGVMHKSNAVPIFSSDEAIEISAMRRG